MTALVQSFPQSTGSMTMLTRPPSAVLLPTQPSNARYTSRAEQYRPSSAPIKPYAFTSTPSLNRIPPADGTQNDVPRTALLPTPRQLISLEPSYNPTAGPLTPFARDDSSILPQRPALPLSRPQSAYIARSPPAQSRSPMARTTPDRYRRPTSRGFGSAQQPVLEFSSSIGAGSTAANLKADIPSQPRHLPSGNKIDSGGQNTTDSPAPAIVGRPIIAGAAADDIQLRGRSTPQSENQRLRRRSMHTFDPADYPGLPTLQFPTVGLTYSPLATPVRAETFQPTAPRSLGNDTAPVEVPTHSRPVSSDSITSRRSNSVSCSIHPTSLTPILRDGTNVLPITIDFRNFISRSSQSLGSSLSLTFVQRKSVIYSSPAANTVATTSTSRPQSASTTGSDRGASPKLANNIVYRASEAVRRVVNPSPLSRATLQNDQTGSPSAAPIATAMMANPAVVSASGPIEQSRPGSESAAMKHLAAIGQTPNKSNSKTARLRRAFSFGSAAEFHKASAVHEPRGVSETQPDASEIKPMALDEQYDVEQAAIARRQEEGGIGTNIYGSKFYTGSTDNMSISSTASSASLMIRKMGRGVKRGTRSLKGLFRPKSVVGDRNGEAIQSEATEATVSMINAEVDRQPQSQPRIEGDAELNMEGPKIIYEPKGIDTDDPIEPVPETVDEHLDSPVSGVSSEAEAAVGSGFADMKTERVDIFPSVRKGILKRTGSHGSLRVIVMEDAPPVELQFVSPICDSPPSSAPATPLGGLSRKRSDSSPALKHEEYVAAAMKLRQNTRSAPVGCTQTRRPAVKRNATFSPRLVFHDTWPSQEYDRRGELATCNRLTPMLAQQIKEELNTFKMEMEVHENSKIYTHFF